MSKPEDSLPIVLVSGASSGIGEAICRLLIDQDYRVIGAARDFYDSFAQCLRPEDVANSVLYALKQPKHVEIAQLVVLPAS